MMIVSTKEVREGLVARLARALDDGNFERATLYSQTIADLTQLLTEEHEEALRENERLERRAGRTLPQG